MTEQKNKSNGSPGLLKKILQLLDVIGALLLFGSWIASNSLSAQAKQKVDMHSSIVDRIRQHRIYEEFSLNINKIQSDLYDVKVIAGQLVNDSDSKETITTPSWEGMSPNQILELNNFIETLESYAGSLSLSQELMNRMSDVRKRANDLISDFESALEEFEKIKKESKTSSEENENLSSQWEEIDKNVQVLWSNYAELKIKLSDVGEMIVEKAAKDSSEASQMAALFGQWAYALYIIGTVMILVGRVAGKMAQKQGGKNEND